MSEELLGTLHNLDRTVLNEVVRQDQRSPTFEVLDWTVEPISFLQVQDATGGLFRFSGRGQDAEEVRPWAVVLKVLKKPAEEGDIRSTFYWKRELLVFQSRMLADVPNVIHAPRCYGVSEREDGGWIWLEYVVEATGRWWSLEHFQRAAHQIGRFGGAYLTGKPLPDYPWLSASLWRGANSPSGFWPNFMNPDSPQNAWQSPVVQEAYPEPLRSQVLQIWAESESCIEAMDRLPQVFCHHDFARRNQMLRTTADGQEEVVAVDWAWCGKGAVGFDAGWLVAATMFLLDYEPKQAAELGDAVWSAYLAGLREAGWRGDERLPRQGFLITASRWLGVLPGWAALMLGEESTVDHMAMYGRPAEGVLAGWLTAHEFLLGYAEEARHLMRELKLD